MVASPVFILAPIDKTAASSLSQQGLNGAVKTLFEIDNYDFNISFEGNSGDVTDQKASMSPPRLVLIYLLVQGTNSS